MPEGQPIVPQRPRARSATPDKARRVRQDPRRSHVDGVREGKLFGEGYRPEEFFYVWVDKANVRRGPEYYQMLGYRVIGPDDGIQCTGRFATKDGELTFMGHVLMACPKERHEEIVQFGPGGDTGLANVAKIEKQIVRRQGLGRDSLRGMGEPRDHFRVVDNGRASSDFEDEEA